MKKSDVLQLVIGNIWRGKMRVVTTSGLIDPDTMTVTLIDPTAVSHVFVYGTDAELSRDAKGVYHCDYQPTIVGRWQVSVVCTGIGTCADNCEFDVIPITL